MVDMIFSADPYDPLSNPRNAGIVQCIPVEAMPYTCDVRRNDCGEEYAEDPRYYNGRFLKLVGHDEQGIIFFDDNRRRVQISNVSCLVWYDQAR